MTNETTNDLGRVMVAELVTAAMGWGGMSGPSISKTGRVGLSTINRVKRLEPVGETMLRALGDVLGLPRDYLLYVLNADLESIVRAAQWDRDLLRWTIDMLGRNEVDMNTRGMTPRTRALLRELGEN